jgi:tetratricopeptide (TPR) repeat protein
MYYQSRKEVYMKILRSTLLVALCGVAIIGLSGCFSWDPGWKSIKDTGKKGDVSGLIAQANKQIADADSKEKLTDLIRTYEQVLEIEPANYEALWSLGRYYVLMGVAYSDNVKLKKEYYLKATQMCERGMYTNSEFKKLVDGGTPVWDASSVLTIREMEAMDYWYTALGWYFKECMNPVEKILNIRNIGRSKKILDRMMAIDPAWAGGHPYTLMATYYAVVPSIMGGDLKKSSEYYNKADDAGAGWLYVRFDRAEFLHAKTGDREAFRKDLEWVLAQDPHKALSPYPWNVYFQREAKKMMEQNK